jgi:hypothetical protein
MCHTNTVFEKPSSSCFTYKSPPPQWLCHSNQIMKQLNWSTDIKFIWFEEQLTASHLLRTNDKFRYIDSKPFKASRPAQYFPRNVFAGFFPNTLPGQHNRSTLVQPWCDLDLGPPFTSAQLLTRCDLQFCTPFNSVQPSPWHNIHLHLWTSLAFSRSASPWHEPPFTYLRLSELERRGDVLAHHGHLVAVLLADAGELEAGGVGAAARGLAARRGRRGGRALSLVVTVLLRDAGRGRQGSRSVKRHLGDFGWMNQSHILSLISMNLWRKHLKWVLCPINIWDEWFPYLYALWIVRIIICFRPYWCLETSF